MRTGFNETVLRLAITVFILLLLEIFSSAIMPAIGFKDYTLAFNVLIVIFLGFRFGGAMLPWFILILSIVHSAFSIEGWAAGTFAGLIVCMLITYLKDIVQISSLFSTVVAVEIFQLVWFLIIALIISAKLGDFSLILPRIWRIIPETIGLSILAPAFFKFLGIIWRQREDDSGVTI